MGTHFTSDEIGQLYDAAIEIGFADRRAALLSGLAPETVGQLARADTPNDQLLQDLHRLNRIEHLRSSRCASPSRHPHPHPRHPHPRHPWHSWRP